MPVLKKHDGFEPESVKKIVIDFIINLTTYDERQLKFVESVNLRKPKFDLLFSDKKMLENAQNHPMTIWENIKNSE